MKLPVYKFILDGSEVRPVYKSLSKKYERESGTQIVKQSLQGDIYLVKDTFNYVYSQSITHEFSFVIQKQNKNGVFEDYFVGKFFKYNCSFDFLKSMCKVSVTQVNKAKQLYDLRDKKFDLIKMSVPTTKVVMQKRATLQLYSINSTTLLNVNASGAYWEEPVIEPTSDANTLKNTYFFEVCKWIGIARVIATNSIDTPEIDVTGTYICKLNYKPDSLNNLSLVYTRIDGKYKLSSHWYQATGYDIKLCEGTITDISTGTKIYECVVTMGSGDNFYWEFKSTGTHYDIKVEDKGPSNYGEDLVYGRLLRDIETVDGLKANKLPVDDFVENRSGYKYAIPFVSSSVYLSDDLRDEPYVYGTNSEGKYYYPPYSSFIKFIPISKASWDDLYSVWFDFSIEVKNLLQESTYKYELRDAYRLDQVISTLLNELDLDLTHSNLDTYSQFLYGNSPFNRSDKILLISPKSNVLKGEYDMPAQKADITIGSIFEMLQNCFKCMWFVEDDKLKIEHVSWFNNGRTYDTLNPNSVIDLTSMHDRFNSKVTDYAQKELDIDLSGISSRYSFEWMDNCTYPFLGSDLTFEAPYLDADKSESITVQDFSTDIDYMQANPNDFSKDGFALISTSFSYSVEFGLGYYTEISSMTLIDSADNRPYNVDVQNGDLAWPNLVKYYLYDAAGPRYKYSATNSGDMVVSSMAKVAKQTVSAQMEEDPSMLNVIKTSLGEGYIESMEINMTTRLTKFELLQNMS